MTKTIVHFRQE